VSNAVAKPTSAQFEVSASVSQSTLNYDKLWSGYSNTSWRPGFSFGIGSEVPVGSRTTLVLDLRYAYLVGRTNFKPEDAVGHFDRTHEIVSVPIFLRRYFGPRSAYFAEFGTDFGILVGAEIVEDYSDDYENYSGTFDALDRMNRVHFGLALGLGVDLSEYGLPFDLRLRYMSGLFGIAKDDPDSWHSDWNLRELGFGITYQL